MEEPAKRRLSWRLGQQFRKSVFNVFAGEELVGEFETRIRAPIKIRNVAWVLLSYAARNVLNRLVGNLERGGATLESMPKRRNRIAPAGLFVSWRAVCQSRVPNAGWDVMVVDDMA